MILQRLFYEKQKNMNIEYGFVYLATLPMRAEASDKTEMVNQLVFGDTYTVIEEKETWLKIKNTYDSYEGWISKTAYYKISSKTFDLINTQTKGLIESHTAFVKLEDKIFPLPLSSQIPLWNGKNGRLNDKKIEIIVGKVNFPEEFNPAKLINIASMFLYAPYLWGGKSIFGIDCSAFVQEVFKFFNIHLPRDAYQQAEYGQEINISEIQIGDLAFFQRENRIIHVGICLGQQKIIHAFDQVRIDKLDETGIFNLDKKHYTHFLEKVIRV